MSRGFKVILVIVLFASQVACAIITVSDSNKRITFNDSDIENLFESDLMSIYGATIRSIYRGDDSDFISDAAFNAVETEVERRNLVTLKSMEEIEQGLVYLYMPTPQLFASLDNLRERESTEYIGYRLQVLIGNTVSSSRGNFIFPDYVPTVAFLCNDKLIGINTYGTTTFETYFSGEASNSYIRTNFHPGYFSEKSAEYLKWRSKGRPIPKPYEEYRGANGWNHPIFELRDKPLNSLLKNTNYLSFARYLDRSC